MEYLGESITNLKLCKDNTASNLEYQLQLVSKHGNVTLARLELFSSLDSSKEDIIRDVLNRLAFENIYSCVKNMES